MGQLCSPAMQNSLRRSSQLAVMGWRLSSLGFHIVLNGVLYSAYKKKVIHIQRPIVLKSINLNICMWPISKEQLILFPLVSCLHHVCHAKMTRFIKDGYRFGSFSGTPRNQIWVPPPPGNKHLTNQILAVSMTWAEEWKYGGGGGIWSHPPFDRGRGELWPVLKISHFFNRKM